MKSDILRSLGLDVIWIFILFLLIFVGLGIWRIKRLAYKMTNQIIVLYETLYTISKSRKTKRGEMLELSFNLSSKELNELHLTFNAVARTLNLAT